MTEIWKQFKSIEVSTLGNLRDAVTKKEVITLKKNAGYLRVHYIRWSTRSDAERSAIASKGWETRRQKNA